MKKREAMEMCPCCGELFDSNLNVYTCDVCWENERFTETLEDLRQEHGFNKGTVVFEDMLNNRARKLKLKAMLETTV